MHRYMHALTAIALGACSASREAPPRSDVVKWTAEAAGVRPAGSDSSIVDIVLRAEVEPGWKVYSLTQKGGGPVPMSVQLPADAPYRIEGAPEGPDADRAKDPNFGIETETYTGQPAFRMAVRLPANADLTKAIELRVRSQACSDKLCLPARTVTVPVTPAGKS